MAGYRGRSAGPGPAVPDIKPPSSAPKVIITLVVIAAVVGPIAAIVLPKQLARMRQNDLIAEWQAEVDRRRWLPSDFDDAEPYLPGKVLPIRIPAVFSSLTKNYEDGDPVGNARVTVSNGRLQEQAQALIDIPTRSDGRVIFSTQLDGADDATEFNVSVVSADGADRVDVEVDLSDLDWLITLPNVQADTPAQLDLAFVVDATGSMADGLEYLKVEMNGIVSSVAQRFPDVDQRYALIVYRDEGDDYVVRTFDFTDSLGEFQQDLSAQSADGGGDYPEAIHEALESAGELSWRSADTARVLFLIADAPPHKEFAQRSLDAVMGLRSEGIAIYPVAASGVAEEAEFLMRTAALLTLAEYCFLTDDSGVGNEHAEPHVPCYAVQRLDTLMIRLISAELAGERIYPEESDIIRKVGNPVNGVCQDEEQPEDPQ